MLSNPVQQRQLAVDSCAAARNATWCDAIYGQGQDLDQDRVGWHLGYPRRLIGHAASSPWPRHPRPAALRRGARGEEEEPRLSAVRRCKWIKMQILINGEEFTILSPPLPLS